MSRTFAPEDARYSYDYNPYYSPEKCGLRLLGEIETAGSYEFCTTIAVQDIETGKVFIAQDTIGSYTTPFEDVKSTGDLIPYENDDQVRRLIGEHHYDNPSPADVHAFLTKIHEAS